MPTDDRLHGRINWPYAAPDRANYRMLGVADLADAVATGRRPRASGELALHVLEIMEAILTAADTGQALDLPQDAIRPQSLSEEEAKALTL
jgi:predicted dehydrogenase